MVWEEQRKEMEEDVAEEALCHPSSTEPSRERVSIESFSSSSAFLYGFTNIPPSETGISLKSLPSH